ncbi:hypothetical protein MRB53_024738 [Persea americana]|uniref:Uncharacterized protein n=1 Tax=Persea americana TaxID=3435 RepID=A0ACC2LDS3_PERAE|nr:hypothetical protein MRB53_024738 [Persea americana]
MAGIQLHSAAFAVPKASYYEVAPPRFIYVAKRHFCITLDTILEEEDVDSSENPHAFSASSSSSSSFSSCCVKVRKPFPTYGWDYQYCA